MNITMVILCLLHGGAERVASLMADHWARAGHRVRILTFVRTDEWPVFYPLDARVEIVPLDLYGASQGPLSAVSANLRRLRVLRAALRAGRPDVVISHVDRETVLTRIATAGLGIPHVGYLHSDPGRRDAARGWRILRSAVLPWVARIVVPTQRGRSALPWAIRRRAMTIANPVDVTPGTQAPLGLPRPNVLSVGGFRPEKNTGLLVRAFARARATHPAWHLVLVGEGPLEEELRALATRLGIAHVVHFVGLVRDIGRAYAATDLFAFPSRHEGFGLALAEALAAGVPAIATDCPVGPAEIARDGVDALVVPNEDEAAFAAGLERLMGDEGLRARLSRRGPEVLARCGLEAIMERWDRLLIELAGLPMAPAQTSTGPIPMARG